ncbi:ribosomal RNA assembly protein [Nematocida displodere]|uniref:KRR-R motif-containing protein 1 n=1 Tax=Nematocida displodere TaxID=1805483 RepID=A0A177EIG5_9MICR|nr:ribosomal RNA assembly protein [Nematocida displodere]
MMQRNQTAAPFRDSTPFRERDVKHAFVETSTFEVMFPKHRERYVREVEEYMRKAFLIQKLSLVVDYHELVLTVSTTAQTRDPYSLFNGRDVLKLVSRGVSLEKAVRVFEEGISCDIIQINVLVRNKDVFIKRRERLIGPHGNTLKSLELLTDCHILPHGNTVSAIGDYKSLREVRRIAVKCMENIHPIYEIKRLMVKKELEKDPNLKNENWERYLPQYKKTHGKKRPELKPKAKKEQSEQNILPDPETRKVDAEIEAGEYFTKTATRERKRKDTKSKPATTPTD